MKYLIIVMVLWGMQVNAQQKQQYYKYKATRYRDILKDKDQEFMYAADWSDISTVIVVNIPDMKLIIYTETNQDFDVLKVDDSWEDDFKDSWLKLHCLDKDGKKCEIRECRLAKPKDENEYILYVDYLDITYVYAMKRD